jgi:GMP synthase (glutamine-hydrolysing)
LARFIGEARLVRTFAGDPIPQDADALVILGGGMSAYDPLPHLAGEIRLLERCVSRGRPVLGICLGSQLLASSLGARVSKAPAKEIGFYRVRAEPGFFGTGDFVAFHWHGDAFSLPEGAVPLASSTATPLQAFRFGEHAWGIQFHLEVDEPVLRAMLGSGAAELSENGVDPDLLLAQARRELPRLEPIAATVFSRWAKL